MGGGGEGVEGDVEEVGVRVAWWREEREWWFVRRRVWCISFRVDIFGWRMEEGGNYGLV